MKGMICKCSLSYYNISCVLLPLPYLIRSDNSDVGRDDGISLYDVKSFRKLTLDIFFKFSMANRQRIKQVAKLNCHTRLIELDMISHLPIIHHNKSVTLLTERAAEVFDASLPFESYSRRYPAGACAAVAVVTVRFANAQRELRASPLNPKVVTSTRSSNFDILDV